jgi:hypothetical protein
VGQEKQGNKVENPWNVRIYSTNMLVLFQKRKKENRIEVRFDRYSSKSEGVGVKLITEE